MTVRKRDRMYIADDSASEATLPAGSICVYVRLQLLPFDIPSS